MQKNGALAATLQRLRETARMSQRELAESTASLGREAAVSVGTIRAIESQVTTPKPQTIQRVADGLARDPFTGAVAPDRSTAIYRELMAAAGYLTSPTLSEPSPGSRDQRSPIEAEIAALLDQIPGASIALTSLARGIQDADDEDREFVVEQLRVLAKRFGQSKAAC